MKVFDAGYLNALVDEAKANLVYGNIAMSMKVTMIPVSAH